MTNIENILSFPKLFIKTNRSDKKNLLLFIIKTLWNRIIKQKTNIATKIQIDKVTYEILPNHGDLGVIIEIQIKNIYEKYNNFIVEDGGVCLDIGANIGCVSLMWSMKNKNGKIYSFEPHPETYLRLKKNIEINKIKNITCFNVAIASENGTAIFTLDARSNMARGSGVLLDDKFNGEEYQVNTISLDSFINSNNITKVDIMKIDIEGMEYECLLAGRNALSKTKKIILEYHSEKLKVNCIKLLEECGFNIKLHPPLIFAYKY